MCNKYLPPDQARIESYFHLGRQKELPWWEQRIVGRDQKGPFVRPRDPRNRSAGLEGVVGQWKLIPPHESRPNFPYSTNNAVSEEVSWKPAFKVPWARGQRCLIPADSFEEPCYETGKNAWWTIRGPGGKPLALAGLWNRWTDPKTGELIESYTMLTIKANHHPLMSRMHKPDVDDEGNPLPLGAQDKRSPIPIHEEDWDTWLYGSVEEAKALIRLDAAEPLEGEPSPVPPPRARKPAAAAESQEADLFKP